MIAQALQRVALQLPGESLELEYQWVGSRSPQAPLMVFLHEGLGSVSMWRDFPDKLADVAGCRGLVYSRPGYGRSTPRPLDQKWSPRFMHHQAEQVLPALLATLGLDTARDPPWLFGHSDGGSIALLHAAAFPEHVAGAVVLAPHLFVEDLSVRSIAKAREAYLGTDLRDKLARHHADVDSAFWGWNDIWLSPDFRAWNIEAEVARITAPVLAVQGEDDEYGTLAQIQQIRAHAPQTELLTLARCGHSPHRDQPERLTAAVLEFVRRRR